MEPWSSTVVRSQKAKLPSVAALHRYSLLGARKRQLGQSGRWKATRAPRTHAEPSCSLLPLLVGCLVGEGMDLEDTPLVVEGFSQELKPPPRVLQKKEPGRGRGCPAQNPFWTTLHSISLLAPSEPYALTSLPHHYRLRPQGGQGQVGQVHTQLDTCTCREKTAVKQSPA